MNNRAALKELVVGLIGWGNMLISIASIALGITALIKGIHWYGKVIEPWGLSLVPILFVLSIPVALLGIFRPLRVAAGVFLMVMATFILVDTWFQSVVTCYASSGPLWTLLGVLIGGVGVVPIALVSCLIQHYWADFIVLVLYFLFGFASRFLGMLFLSDLMKDPF